MQSTRIQRLSAALQRQSVAMQWQSAGIAAGIGEQRLARVRECKIAFAVNDRTNKQRRADHLRKTGRFSVRYNPSSVSTEEN